MLSIIRLSHGDRVPREVSSAICYRKAFAKSAFALLAAVLWRVYIYVLGESQTRITKPMALLNLLASIGCTLLVVKIISFFYARLKSPLRDIPGPPSKSFVFGSFKELWDPVGHSVLHYSQCAHQCDLRMFLGNFGDAREMGGGIWDYYDNQGIFWCESPSLPFERSQMRS
jgi:hypothetical protein